MKRTPLIAILTAIALIASGCNLYTWGKNNSGEQLTTNAADTLTPTNRNTDVGSYTDWAEISVGLTASCGIREAGTLWCWGDENAAYPVQRGTGADWVAVADGACGIRANQTLWCWEDFNAPAVEQAPGTTWATISARRGTFCGIQTDQSLWCWGNNSTGQLGLGDSVDRSQPSQVGDPGTTWSDITIGTLTTCGVQTNGSLWCWGRELQPGAGTIGLAPVQIGASTDWQHVEVGDNHACVLHTDSSLWCWGENGYGVLGVGDQTARATPTQVSGNATWLDIAATEITTCGLQADGSLWCWGKTTLILEDRSFFTPREVEGALWSSLAANGESDYRASLCGIQTSGSAWCATYGNDTGNAGTGWISPNFGANDSTLAERVGVTQDFLEVSAGGALSCGLRESPPLAWATGTIDRFPGAGSVWCWGDNTSLILGAGVGDADAPLIDSYDQYFQITAGRSHVCGLYGEQNTDVLPFIACGGDNSFGQSDPPFVNHNQRRGWAAVSAGAFHNCGISFDEFFLNGEYGIFDTAVRCWGANESGQLGGGNTGPGPVLLPHGAEEWVAIDAGDAHTCAIQGSSGGSLWCWGSNAGGRLGDGTTTQRLTPVQVGTATNWTQVDAGGTHTCAIRTNGQLWCWGTNNRGQLGQGDTTNRTSPTRVGTASNWTHVTTGFNFTCGLRTAPIGHDLYCWGANNNGRLGDGTTTQRNTPIEIGAGTNWATVDAGDGHVAATRITD